jgi:hypothetical protein
MASKILGVLDSVSQQITVERTDGSPSGPHTFNIVDGAYFALDRGVAEADSGATGATMDTADEHTFEVGDAVTVWRPSTDALVFVETVAAVPNNLQITFSSSQTWLAGDLVYVSDDLIGYITTRVRSQASVFGAFTLSLSKGIASMVHTGSTTDVSWPTADVQRWLRYSGTVTITGASESPDPDRQMEGYLWLDKEIQRDKLVLEPRASQSRSVTGQIETLYRAALRTRAIRIRTQGPPRSTLKTTYQAAEDLWSSHFAQGKRWRAYVDTTIQQPWVLFTNPRGYETFVHLGPSKWDPELLARGYDNYLDATIPAQVYVP